MHPGKHKKNRYIYCNTISHDSKMYKYDSVVTFWLRFFEQLILSYMNLMNKVLEKKHLYHAAYRHLFKLK